MVNNILRTVVFFFVLGVAGNAAAQTLYGANGAGGNPATVLVTLNPVNGAVLSTIGPIGMAVTGLAVHPTTGVMYGTTGGNSPVAPNSLIRINRVTGVGTLIGATGLTDPVADISFRANGTLFGWSEDTDDLVTLNLTTGVATVVGPSGVGTAGSGLAFSPGGTLFFTGQGAGGALATVNPVTGLVTAGPIMTNSPNGNQINALAFRGAILFGSDFAGGGAAGAANLITINTTTGVITDLGATIPGLDAIVFAAALAPGAGGPLVPTMSEWALLLMALLMAATAFWAARKRN